MADKVPVFSNFTKATNDFFTKGFPTSHKLELTTATENGLTFITSAEKKKPKDKDKDDRVEYWLGKLETKYKGAQGSTNVEFTGTVDTDNLIKGDLSLSSGSVPGLKFILKPQTGGSQEVTGGLEFQNEHASASTSVLWKAAGDTQLTATLVGGRNGVRAGVESSYFFTRKGHPTGLDSVRGLLNYKTSALDLTVFAKNQWNVESKEESTPSPHGRQQLTLGASYQHNPATDTVLHSALEWDTTKPLTRSITAQFGGSYTLDKDTSAQAKFNTDGKLTLHLAKQVSPHVKATLTSEWDTFALAGAEHKFAVGVLYKA